jgi:hypothetical protein
MSSYPSLSESFYAVADQLVTKRASVNDANLITGLDPTNYNTGDPIRLWIIQLAVIVGTCHLFGFFLRKINQPQVIAEIIGGIFLGPSVMGRVPGFSKHIFPTNSIPFLNLTAYIG